MVGLEIAILAFHIKWNDPYVKYKSLICDVYIKIRLILFLKSHLFLPLHMNIMFFSK